MASNRSFNSLKDLPSSVAVFPLAGCLLLPRSDLTLNIFEPRYVAMIDDALHQDRMIGMVQPLYDQVDAISPQLSKIGCLGRLTQFSETGDGRYLISLTGLTRFRILSEAPETTGAYRRCLVDYSSYAADLADIGEEQIIDRKALFRALRIYAEKNDLSIDWDSVEKAPSEALVNALSMMSPFGVREKQALLEAPDVCARADVLIALAEIELASNDPDRPPLH